MWGCRMLQQSSVATRLTLIFQHYSEARKLKSNCSINLKSAKSSWRCCRRGQKSYFYSELASSAIRREGDDAMVNFRIDRIQTVQEWSHNITNTKLQEFSVDLQIQNQLNSKYRWFCLVTGCVSRPRDARQWCSYQYAFMDGYKLASKEVSKQQASSSYL